MYDPLLEADPWVQEFGGRKKAEGKAEGEAKGKAKGRAEGVAEGRTEGQIETMRQNIATIVRLRFPDLSESVIGQIQQSQDLMALQEVLVTLVTMQDSLQIRQYLQHL